MELTQVDRTMLRKKLEILQYDTDFDERSASLIERLVDDLIHTTQSYRDLRSQLDQQQTEKVSFDSKVSDLFQL